MITMPMIMVTITIRLTSRQGERRSSSIVGPASAAGGRRSSARGSSSRGGAGAGGDMGATVPPRGGAEPTRPGGDAGAPEGERMGAKVLVGPDWAGPPVRPIDPGATVPGSAILD